MPILYKDGQPWRVPDSELREFLRQGFRSEPPVTIAQVAKSEPIAPTEELPSVALPSEASVDTSVAPASSGGKLRINEASMSAIAKALPQVGTVAARKITNARKEAPFQSVEDLIAAEPEVDWLSLAHLIAFE